MKVVEMKPKEKEKPPKASDMFQSLADMYDELEKSYEDNTGEELFVEVVSVGLGPYGLDMMSNAYNPDGINMILDMAKRTIIDMQFEGEVQDDGTVH